MNQLFYIVTHYIRKVLTSAPTFDVCLKNNLVLYLMIIKMSNVVQTDLDKYNERTDCLYGQTHMAILKLTSRVVKDADQRTLLSILTILRFVNYCADLVV